MFTTHIALSDIQHFQIILLDWFALKGRSFPWREPGLSVYKLVIAEVLLQRTKAEVVNNHFMRFIAEFPDWQSIAKANIKKIEASLGPLGLASQRAPRLVALAEEMSLRNSVLPTERAELQTLPLFGQYISNAVEQVVFNRKKPLLDVNMVRVLERYFGYRKLEDIRYDPYLQELAHRVVDHENSKLLNWAILDFAAIVCKSVKPQCVYCPLNLNCLYFDKILKSTD